ncbi:MAG: hypothetical protein HYZ53_28545 [Planctomycetes bacterium]|nr:hypothetical protein [Planctomycetota bacterium]
MPEPTPATGAATAGEAAPAGSAPARPPVNEAPEAVAVFAASVPFWLVWLAPILHDLGFPRYDRYSHWGNLYTSPGTLEAFAPLFPLGLGIVVAARARTRRFSRLSLLPIAAGLLGLLLWAGHRS